MKYKKTLESFIYKVASGESEKKNSEKSKTIDWNIEVFTQTELSGWAWNPRKKNEPARIELFSDDALIATCLADTFRPDLESAGKSDGKCAFRLKFDPPLSGTAALELRVAGEAVPLPELPVLETPAPAPAPAPEEKPQKTVPNIVGFVDRVSITGAIGWAWMPTRPDKHLTVEAIVGDMVVAEAKCDLFRDDLKDAGIGDGLYAFKIAFIPPVSDEEIPTFRIREYPEHILQGNSLWYPSEEQGTALNSLPPNVPVPPSAEFFLEDVTANRVVGWAWYPAAPNELVSVELIRDNEVVVDTVANLYREDLSNSGQGTGYYGFDIEFENIEGCTLCIGGSIRCLLHPLPEHEEQTGSRPKLANIEGSVDWLDRSGASGWVWSPSDPDVNLMVEARLEGRVIGRATAELLREDLIPYGKNHGRYGFSLKYYETLTGDVTPDFQICLPDEIKLSCAVKLPRLSAEDQARRDQGTLEKLLEDHQYFTKPGPEYEDPDPAIISRLDTSGLAASPLVFAYYLPQFHAIPVNDACWGKGFTEWRQISRGLPRFPGHYQPRIPRDLGFYDLTDSRVLFSQAEMAKAAGINAFCYYYYWFNGERVLDAPLNAHLDSDVDMPFMIMWANENWTKTWDGFEKDVILRQDYKDEDEAALLADLARHFSDPRYVRVDGRPLFFLYNPRHLPDVENTVRRWRDRLISQYGHDPIIFMAQAFDAVDPQPFGLDGAIEFPPHKLATPNPGRSMPDAYSRDFEGRVIAYEDFIHTSLDEPAPEFPLIKTIVPSWDNDARRPGRGLTLEHSTPAKYQNWLESLIERAIDNPVYGVPMVAVNAWNEWAEAAYLEPDVHFGGAYLNATARGIVNAVNNYVPVHQREAFPKVSVILPCYNHARFLPERIGSILEQTVPPAEIIFLDDASTDNSVEVARGLLEGCDIPWRIEVNTANSGNVFRQWLKGLELASNDLIWVAETDDSADRDFLRNLLPSFRDEGVSGAYGHIQCVEPDGTRRADLDQYYQGFRHHSWNKSSVTTAAQSFEFDFSVRNVVPNASGFVFRRPVLTQTERDRLLEYRFAGDWYFYALVLRGGSLAYCRGAKSWFRVNAASASRSAFFTEQHLNEHRMVLADIAAEYGLSEETLRNHASRLAVYFDYSLEDIIDKVRPQPVDRKLRICIAAHSFSVGGGEVVPLELANKLKRLGHHVTYLVMERQTEGASSIRPRLRQDIPVIYWDDVKDDVPAFITSYRFDVLNSHNVGVDYHLYRLGVDLPCAWIVSLHGGYETVSSLLNKDFIAYLENHVDCWLSLADKNRKVLLDAGLSNADFRESFNSVSDIEIEWESKSKFYSRFGLAKDAFLMVLCSRAIKEKGWETAISVCQRLNREQTRPVHLFLIGDGPDLAEMQSGNEEDPHVHFMGHVENPMRYYRCFDMAIFPTTYIGETFPMFLVECLAAGLPIVSTDIGEIPRIMIDKGVCCGSLTSHHNTPEAMAEEMSSYILTCLAPGDVLREAKKHARRGAQRFSMTRLAELYLSIMSEKIRRPETVTLES